MGNANHSGADTQKTSAIVWIAGIAAGLVALCCCCGGGIAGIWFTLPGPGSNDIVGRWEIDEIAKLILEFRADGTGTIEIPEVRVRIPITYKLQGNDLTIAPAPGPGLGPDTREVIDRLGRTRVTRLGDTLNMEATAGPARGQLMVLRKVN